MTRNRKRVLGEILLIFDLPVTYITETSELENIWHDYFGHNSGSLYGHRHKNGHFWSLGLTRKPLV